MKKVVHLTSVHPRNDTRVYYKESCSLSRAGYQVFLIVADGLGDEMSNGISILDVGRPKGRINRILFTTDKIIKKAIDINAAIYHLHDPELLPIGYKLKKLGFKVIFDSHEDVPRQILSKNYLNKWVRKLVSFIYSYYEKWICRKLDLVICATPSIGRKFNGFGVSALNICNYPILSELDGYSPDRQKEVCYIGGISENRGIKEMIESLKYTSDQVRLNLCGNFSTAELQSKCLEMVEWERVNFLGYVNRQIIREVLHRSSVGLVVLHDEPNHIEGYPIKLFEYMAAGLPVIASNFPLWCEIVENNNCGICVDPLNIQSIANAINFLFENEDECKKMGENGRSAILRYFNWCTEEEKLINVYKILCQ